MARLPPNLLFDQVESDEVSAAHELETEAFPEDEVSPIEQFRMRQKVAPELFLGAFLPLNYPSENARRIIVAFICATRSVHLTLTQASMKTHEPEGSSVCIHNVVVSSAYQRRGVGVALLQEYIARVRKDGLTERIILICHDYMRPLYEKVGFEYVGPSTVIIGHSLWHEMKLVLSGHPREKATASRSINGLAAVSLQAPNLRDAHQQSSLSHNQFSPRLLTSFPGGIGDISADSGESKSNKYDILCPRTGCGSLILRAGIGHLSENNLPQVQLEPGGKRPSELFMSLPPAGASVSCWLIQPNPMAFENIGFSHAVEQKSSNQVPGEKPRLKLLSCADCDLGPLGWCMEGGHDFWLPCGRVSYRA